MTSDNWIHEKALEDIATKKLEFLQKLAFESVDLEPKQKMPFLLALANRAKQEQISFTPDEIERIIAVLKQHASPNEIAKMDQVLKMFKQKSQ